MRQKTHQPIDGDPMPKPTQAAGVPVTAGLMLIVCGPGEPRAIPLPAYGELVIGRHPSCHVSLPDPALSGHHARFTRRGAQITVEDLGSRQGTWLADKRVEKAEIGLGNAVRLASVVVAVALDEHAHRAVAAAKPAAVVPEAMFLSQRMQEIRALLHRVAPTDLPVMLFGETGTGKELAARELHRASRRKGPLRVINCAAIPHHLIESTLFGHERGAFTSADRSHAGIFEDAKSGTVFLDEVGELSLAAQAALLRVLESRRVTRVGSNREIEIDARVVAATHRDLHAMTTRGEFRADAFHRLCVIAVELPPLRSRRDEIAPLARHFLAQEHGAKEIDPRALSRLEEYDWPGNIRELRNVLARAAILAQQPCITEGDLAEHLRTRALLPCARELAAPSGPTPTWSQGSLRARLESLERAEMEHALESTDGNQRRAAELLGVPLRTFERRLRAWRGAPRM